MEPVLLAKDTGLSITEPRVSPDGRWLLFCMSEYGEFPVFQPSSDLYLMDLKTRQLHPAGRSTARAASRGTAGPATAAGSCLPASGVDGVFARLYFSYVDEQGRAHKPVLLPQKDPTFYDRFLKTYNAPELARTPVPATERALVEAICQRDLVANTGPTDRNN